MLTKRAVLLAAQAKFLESGSKERLMKNTSKITIENLKKKVAKFRDERRWKKAHNPKNLAMAIAVEAAELMELFAWKNLRQAEKMKENSKELRKIRDELADVIIYCLAFADKLEIDLSKAILDKLAKNRKKYPIKPTPR